MEKENYQNFDKKFYLKQIGIKSLLFGIIFGIIASVMAIVFGKKYFDIWPLIGISIGSGYVVLSFIYCVFSSSYINKIIRYIIITPIQFVDFSFFKARGSELVLYIFLGIILFILAIFILGLLFILALLICVGVSIISFPIILGLKIHKATKYIK